MNGFDEHLDNYGDPAPRCDHPVDQDYLCPWCEAEPDDEYTEKWQINIEQVTQEIMDGMDCYNPSRFEKHIRNVLARYAAPEKEQ
jgi:hypothetical protein